MLARIALLKAMLAETETAAALRVLVAVAAVLDRQALPRLLAAAALGSLVTVVAERQAP